MAKNKMGDMLRNRMTAARQASELEASDEAYQQIFREKAPTGTTELCDLPLDKLVPFYTADIGFRPYPPSKLEALSEQLQEDGLFVRIIVRPASAGNYEILSGHNRVAAAKLAGWDTIPSEVVEADDARAIVIATSTNLIQRQGLSIVERGKAYKALLDAKNHHGQWYIDDAETFGENRQKFDGAITNTTNGRQRYNARKLVAEFFGVTEYEIRKAIKLTQLIPGLADILESDPKRLNLACADLSVTGAAIQGATFQLRYLAGTSGTGGTVIGQQVTSKNGTAMWTGLKPGTYVLEELDPADGYSIIQSSETVFLADSGEQSVVTVIFQNAPDGSLLIRKVCAVNPGTTLQDAEFKITYSDGTLIGDSNGIFVTDENGEIRIDGLKPGKSVVVTETKAPDGFIIDTQSQTIQIKEGRTVSLTFKNQPMGSLIIQKRDSITGQPLPGAEFRVTTAAGCEVGLDGVIGSSTLTQNGIFTTDSNGEIRISNLAPGALVVTEVRAPNGYVMDSPSTNVVIGTNGDTQTVVITNTPKGGLLIRKIDSVTGKALPGVKFKITAANGELVPDNEGLTSSNGIYTTDENGQIYLQKLNPNTYVVTEIETVDGYLLDAMPQTVVVDGADTQVLTFTNMPLGGLLIKKMDSATKEPLADVIFKITRTDGTVVGNSNGEYRTDERGYISLPDLEPGSYIVREVQAKMGYLLDDTPHAVEIKDHQTYTLEVFNQPLGNLIINKLSSADNSPLEGVKFQIKYANGQVVDNKNRQVSSNGIYYKCGGYADAHVL